MICTWHLAKTPLLKLRITTWKYYLWYLYQMSLQIMLLPIQIHLPSAVRRCLKLVKLYLSWFKDMFEEIKLYILTIFVVVVNFRPSFSREFFFSSWTEFHHDISDISSQLDLSRTLSLPLMVMRHNMIRITFTALILRVIVNKVSLKVLPQIRRKEWWQKLNLFTPYNDNFWRYFVCSSFAGRPRNNCAGVSHEMAQFVLKIA